MNRFSAAISSNRDEPQFEVGTLTQERAEDTKPRLANRTLCLAAMLALNALLFAGIAAAQSNNLVTDLGVRPYQTYAGDNERVNLATGNLSVTIPLLSLPGRNGHDFTLSVTYNSKKWVLVCVDGSCAWAYQPAPLMIGGVRPLWWQVGFLRLFYDFQFEDEADNVRCRENYSLVMPDGTSHAFPTVTSHCEEQLPGPGLVAACTAI
ncbi:MAG: hypothetical protein ACRD2Y_05630 [Terriglobales bacterium]